MDDHHVVKNEVTWSYRGRIITMPMKVKIKKRFKIVMDTNGQESKMWFGQKFKFYPHVLCL